jgi:hypothetical protein
MKLREIGWDGVVLIDKPVESSCEHGIENLGSMKYWEVLELLLKKGSAP